MKSTIKVILLSTIIAFGSLACAEDPSPIVKPRVASASAGSGDGDSGKTGDDHDHDDEDTIELLSLHYKGIDDGFGIPCNVYISIREIHDEHHHDVLKVYAQSDLILHYDPDPEKREYLADWNPEFYKFKRLGNTYFPRTSSEAGTQPALSQAILNNNEEPDLNKIREYVAPPHRLVQYARLSLDRRQNLDEFESSFESAIESEILADSDFDILDSADELKATIMHVDHPDNRSCEDLELQPELVKVEYELDPDHDHGHHH